MAKVSVGPSSVAGGAVTLAAYATAVVAFAQGAQDEATISAVVVGTLALVTTLGGRYAQAVALVLQGWKNAPPAPFAEQRADAAKLAAAPGVVSSGAGQKKPTWVEVGSNPTASQMEMYGTSGVSSRPMVDIATPQHRVLAGGTTLGPAGGQDQASAKAKALTYSSPPAPEPRGASVLDFDDIDLSMFDPDGEPRDGDRMATAPDESFIADPDDTDGADDHPEAA